MKKLLSFLFLIFFSFSLLAVTSSLKGTIIDAGTQLPVDFVNVALFKQGSEKPLKGVTSDKNGTFIFPSVENGKYNIRVSFVGYKTVKKAVNMAGSALNLGKIVLEENSKALSEVEVLGQGTQMRFDVDKKIYSVDKAITSAGGSASDVLRNIPSVKVDNDGNVSLRKDANVEVWINGKPSGLTVDNRAQVLQQMPAESIQSIEVMTNPSAKFSPEGTAGIINLVLKKNRKAGYYGSVSSGAMYPDGGKVTPTLGASINYSSSLVDAFANVGYRAMNFVGGGKNERYNYNVADTTLLEQTNKMTNNYSGLFFRAGVDFHLDSLNTIGISGFGTTGGGNSSNSIEYSLNNISTNTLLRNYSRGNEIISTRPSLNVGMNYRHDFDKKGENNLLASIGYSNHGRGSDNTISQSDLVGKDFMQKSYGTMTELELKADYTRKFTESSRFEAGWLTTLSTRNSNASAMYVPSKVAIPTYSNRFNYDEQIHAGYVTYGDRFGKLSLQAGLRGEYFWRQFSSNTTFIAPSANFQLYPSLYLSYSLPKDNELQLNYTRRVNHPRGRQLNTFHDYSDSTSITYGNPYLSPEYSMSLEFNYMKTWENHSLMLSAYYHNTDNCIEDVRFRNGNIMENTYMNLIKHENSGVEIVAKNRVFKIVNLTSTLNMYYTKMGASQYTSPYDSTKITILDAHSTFTWSANVLANFILGKTWSGQITAEYSAPTIIAQGIENPEYQVDLGLRKTFFDRKLSVGLMVTDIFNLNKERTITWGDGFYQSNESYFHRRMIGLTVSYNFGNMKPKQNEMKKQVGGELNMEGGE